MKISDKVYPHLAALAGFVVVALVYFYPVLQGKEISQSDIIQYTGMANEQNNFRQTDKAEPYWTNAAFGGMPTYQLGAQYPHNYVKKLDAVIRFLPRPADYLFLYFASFYVLLLVLKTDPLKAFFGAVAFGLSTYLIIIIGVGHNAKAHAIGYMPLVVAGIIMVFQRRYILGGLLTMVAAALEINANHFQMTYYLLIFLLIAGSIMSYPFFKAKQFADLGKIVAVFGIGALVAVGTNAANLMATAEYADFSTRGKSDLTINPDGLPKDSDVAMSKEYITEYSYGIGESLNLVVPRLFGGSNSENLGDDSEVYQWIIAQGYPEDQALGFASALPTYWGEQPIVAAPAYIGAVVFFLALIGIFLVKGRIKYVLVSGAMVSLFLSWGKNMPLVTDFMIDNFPLYNKFRAISSIQVILELCMPALAILGLQAFFTVGKEQQFKAWRIAGIGVIGLIVVLFLCKSAFSFSGPNDEMFLKQFGVDFLNALIADRKTLYSADLLRSGFFIFLTATLLYLTIRNGIVVKTAVILIGLLMIGDLFFIAKKYVSDDAFVSAMKMREPFERTQADQQILTDTTHYRVFELDGNLNSARASYFHKSIGGYHAAKPRRLQELFDYQIARNNVEVLNMLNVKYLLQTDKDGQMQPMLNVQTYGNAWFVSKVVRVNSANAEMTALSKINRQSAIVNTKEFDYKLIGNLQADSTANVKLRIYKPNYLQYQSENSRQGLAVFSEMYYPHGWKSYIDGKEVGHIRANYALRAMIIPAGKHIVEFKFVPQVVKTGGMLSLASCIAMGLLLVGGVYYEIKQKD